MLLTKYLRFNKLPFQLTFWTIISFSLKRIFRTPRGYQVTYEPSLEIAKKIVLQIASGSMTELSTRFDGVKFLPITTVAYFTE